MRAKKQTQTALSASSAFLSLAIPKIYPLSPQNPCPDTGEPIRTARKSALISGFTVSVLKNPAQCSRIRLVFDNVSVEKGKFRPCHGAA